MIPKISKKSAIKLNIYKQGLIQRVSESKSPVDIIKNIGCVQMDTLNIVTRSPNLVFHSRLSDYKENDFYSLYGSPGGIIESYIHALSIIPVEEYQYWIHSKIAFREKYMSSDQENIDLILEVYNNVKKNYPSTSRDLTKFFYEGDRVLQAWEMSPVRSALDILWRSGLLEVKRDDKFQKAFYPIEQIVPVNLLGQPVSKELTYERYTIKALRAMGAATVKDIADYFRLPVKEVRNILKKLITTKRVRNVNVEHDNEEYFILESDLNDLEDLLPKIENDSVKLLSPFDNLIWYRLRVLRLFEIDYRMESYIPEPSRKFGYFALPILIGDKIIGTIDLKVKRKDKTLIIKRVFFYNTFDSERYIDEIAYLLRDMAVLTNCSDISVNATVSDMTTVINSIYDKI